MRLVITYDISKDKIRNRVYKILESYGAWKQMSVFEIEVSKRERVELEDKLKNEIEKKDSIRIYHLCDRCLDEIETYGRSENNDSSPVV